MYVVCGGGEQRATTLGPSDEREREREKEILQDGVHRVSVCAFRIISFL